MRLRITKLLLAAFAFWVSTQWGAANTTVVAQSSCSCATWPVLYDYSNNVITNGGEQDYSGSQGSATDCANWCQSNVLNEADALCDAQGWDSAGQGYVKIGSGYDQSTNTFQSGWGWDYAGQQFGDVGPQQYDCSSV